ncbi:hypothetical protein [Verrucosispora sp. NA02020]|uniref:hypothetical protein n=2 Tax=unclassified Micromonospora TaxID=2617518 RepID=UPI0015900EAA|nr:hypothetical protein [Verrucosispora sp. NA02020]QKW11403.1 hypothetical protein HUT12_00440 [Verrucosispora sp. NA02020]
MLLHPNDRVATRRTSAQDIQTPAHIAAPVNPLSLTAARLARLSNGQLAVAIHAAGIPTDVNVLSISQIRELAVTGIRRLGRTEVRRINDETRAANTSYCAKIRRDPTADVHAELATINRIWGSRRREQRAVDLAYRLLCALTRSGHSTPEKRSA